jgi:hypothetical protein
VVTTGLDPDPHGRRVSQAGCHDRHGAAKEHGAAYFHWERYLDDAVFPIIVTLYVFVSPRKQRLLK